MPRAIELHGYRIFQMLRNAGTLNIPSALLVNQANT